jgi:hypothetical protein
LFPDVGPSSVLVKFMVETAIQTQTAKSGELIREVSSLSYNSNVSGGEPEDDSARDLTIPINAQIVHTAVRAPIVRKVQTPNGWLQCASFGEPIKCRPHVTRGVDVAGFIPLKCPLSER